MRRSSVMRGRMTPSFVLLLSSVTVHHVAVAVRVPSSAYRPFSSTIRCASPVMVVPADDEATRDLEPTVVDPSKPPAIKEGMSFADYLKAKRSTGAVVSTNMQQASQPVKAAAPAPVPAPVPMAAPAPAQEAPTVLVQGNSLRTWSYPNPALERVQVVLSSEGRPVDAEVELWQGPGNIPVRMRVYVEDGALLPFGCVIATPNTVPSARPSFGDNVNAKPRAVPSTVAVRNVGQLEFPIAACVSVNGVARPSAECVSAPSNVVQGGALRTYPFDAFVESLEVLLQTDGRPLNARIEILQGPNNNKQIVELYSEDGLDRPFFAIFATPGPGAVVRVINTASMEYPLTASIVPHELRDFDDDGLDALSDGLNVVGDPPRVGRYDTLY